jgi:acyl dehydratase
MTQVEAARPLDTGEKAGPDSRGQVYFDDVSVGIELPRLVKGPMTTLHVMRWSAATENWHRIHYDLPFAREVDGLPNVLVNGSWKQHVCCQLMKDWTGHEGWVWRIRFEFRDMDPVGNTIIGGGKVEEIAEHDGLGYARCSIYLTNQLDKVTTIGAAIGVLPKRGGRPVPYPFKPPEHSPVTW